MSSWVLVLAANDGTQTTYGPMAWSTAQRLYGLHGATLYAQGIDVAMVELEPLSAFREVAAREADA